MPTVQQLAIHLNREVAESLTRNAAAMPADKLTWSPLDQGRTALSQLAECAVITEFTTNLLKTRAMPPIDSEAFGKKTAELDTVEKATAALKANIDTLSSVIESFPDADLDATIQLPWFSTPQTFAQVMFICYWNNVYHQGQIAFIQTLYGDKEMH